VIFHFRTGFTASSSREFGHGVLVDDRFEIAKRYFTTYFLVDFVAVLPLPQVLFYATCLVNLQHWSLMLGKMAFGSFFHVRPGCRFRLTSGFG
jgi:cyclic nucleotide gated channel